MLRSLLGSSTTRQGSDILAFIQEQSVYLHMKHLLWTAGLHHPLRHRLRTHEVLVIQSTVCQSAQLHSTCSAVCALRQHFQLSAVAFTAPKDGQPQ